MINVKPKVLGAPKPDAHVEDAVHFLNLHLTELLQPAGNRRHRAFGTAQRPPGRRSLTKWLSKPA
jgi:hypothetical protein